MRVFQLLGTRGCPRPGTLSQKRCGCAGLGILFPGPSEPRICTASCAGMSTTSSSPSLKNLSLETSDEANFISHSSRPIRTTCGPRFTMTFSRSSSPGSPGIRQAENFSGLRSSRSPRGSVSPNRKRSGFPRQGDIRLHEARNARPGPGISPEPPAGRKRHRPVRPPWRRAFSR